MIIVFLLFVGCYLAYASTALLLRFTVVFWVLSARLVLAVLAGVRRLV